MSFSYIENCADLGFILEDRMGAGLVMTED